MSVSLLLRGIHAADDYLATPPNLPVVIPDNPTWLDGFLTRVLTADLDDLPAHRLHLTGSPTAYTQMITQAHEFGYHTLPPAIDWAPAHAST